MCQIQPIHIYRSGSNLSLIHDFTAEYFIQLCFTALAFPQKSAIICPFGQVFNYHLTQTYFKYLSSGRSGQLILLPGFPGAISQQNIQSIYFTDLSAPDTSQITDLSKYDALLAALDFHQVLADRDQSAPLTTTLWSFKNLFGTQKSTIYIYIQFILTLSIESCASHSQSRIPSPFHYPPEKIGLFLNSYVQLRGSPPSCTSA